MKKHPFTKQWLNRTLSLVVLIALTFNVPTVNGSAKHRYLLVSAQELLDFDRDVQRVALSDDKIITFELVTSRQLLIQARKQGRTNILVWFENGSVESIEYSVGTAAKRMEGILTTAIHGMSDGVGKDVTVRRVVRGSVPSDSRDLFILEGKVPHQIALTRVLSIASFIISGKRQDGEISLRAFADETGALLGDQGGSSRSQSSSSGRVGGSSSGQGGSSGQRGSSGGGLQNGIKKSLARAKIVEGSKGRLLSFIDVEDIPRVRVAIRMLQVDRTKLKDFGSQITLINSDRANRNLNRIDLPTAIGSLPQQNTNSTGTGVPDFQNVLSALSGSLTNQTQYAATHFAVDSILSALESKGITRTLAEPTLSVLSGESAVFLVGGQVPIPTATATTAVVFNAIEFANFGVELSVRPLVEEDDSIVIDIQPRVSDPVTNTFSTVTTAPAFETKELQTTARLKDGESMITAGLIKRSTQKTNAKTPKLAEIPFLGWMFRDANHQERDTELVIIVTPTIEREPIADLNLWSFPESSSIEAV